jgi:hypothetical protein
MLKKYSVEPMATDMRDWQNLEAMDPSNPHQLRKSFLLHLARVNARWLPSLSNIFSVFVPYLLLQRHDQLPLDNYIECFANTMQDFDGRVQRRARELHVDYDLLVQKAIDNIMYLLATNHRMTLLEAIDRYLSSISADHLDVASEANINSAIEHLINDLRWVSPSLR